MEKYICSMCGWEYDPQKGFPVFGVKPGTPFEDVPEDFCCPVCGASKKNFMLRYPPGSSAPPAASDGSNAG